ncbi:MAG: sulfur carrier protein ThiS [Acidobacteria bacterium]|nr:sulfur carrier protein ThiS [Acidobacteriota bacterium]
MCAPLNIHLNGQPHAIPGTEKSLQPVDLAGLVTILGLKEDRVAVELNGNIVTRSAWASTQVLDGDRLEIVHFVGGGR